MITVKAYVYFIRMYTLILIQDSWMKLLENSQNFSSV